MKKIVTMLLIISCITISLPAVAQEGYSDPIDDIIKGLATGEQLRSGISLKYACEWLETLGLIPTEISYFPLACPLYVSCINNEWKIARAGVTLVYGDSCKVNLFLHMPKEEFNMRQKDSQHHLWRIITRENALSLLDDENGIIFNFDTYRIQLSTSNIEQENENALDDILEKLDENTRFRDSKTPEYIMIQLSNEPEEDGSLPFYWLDRETLLELNGWEDMILGQDCELQIWRDGILDYEQRIDMDSYNGILDRIVSEWFRDGFFINVFNGRLTDKGRPMEWE